MTKTNEATPWWRRLVAAASMAILGLGAVQLAWPYNKSNNNGDVNTSLFPRSLLEVVRELREEGKNAARTRRATTTTVQNTTTKTTKQKFLLLLGPRIQRYHGVEQDLLRWSEASIFPNWTWPMLKLPKNTTASERNAANFKKLSGEFLTKKPNGDTDTAMQAKYRRTFSKIWEEGLNIVFGRDSLASLMTGSDITGDRLRQRFLETMPWVPSTKYPSSLAGSKEDNLQFLLIHHEPPRITGFLQAWLGAKQEQTMAQFLVNVLEATRDTDGRKLRTMLDPLNLVHQLVIQHGFNVVLVEAGGVEKSGKQMSHVVACEVMGVPCKNGYVFGMDADTNQPTSLPKSVNSVQNSRRVLKTKQHHTPTTTTTNNKINHGKSYTKNIDPDLVGPKDDEYLQKLDDILTEFDQAYCHLFNHPSLHLLYQDSLFSACPKKTTTTDANTQSKLLSEAYAQLKDQIQSLATSWHRDSAIQLASGHRYHPYNTTNPHPSWCPTATCINTPQCSPCQRRFLLEIATGRSGSTSLLRMLNLLPGVRLSGENNNQLFALYQMTHNIESHTMFRYGRTTGAWAHEELGKMDMACPVQSMVAMMDPPKFRDQLTLARSNGKNGDAETILGFKTVRFMEGWPSDEIAVKFLRDKFPCSRIVININSNVEKQSGSSWWKYKKDESKEKLQGWNDRLLKVAQKLGPRQAHVLDSDQWANNVTSMNEMVEWLGFRNCVFEEVLHDNDHGKKGALNLDRETTIDFGPDCRYVG